jgi:hypothetical protein
LEQSKHASRPDKNNEFLNIAIGIVGELSMEDLLTNLLFSPII